MSMHCYEMYGVRILAASDDGPLLQTDRDAATLIGDAIGHQAAMLLVPVARLGDDFFDLSTRIAGAIVQKFVNYGLSLAIVGDISQRTQQSKSLRDFVYEANRGDRIWFVNSSDELHVRLSGKRN